MCFQRYRRRHGFKENRRKETEDPVEGRRACLDNRMVWDVYLEMGEQDGIEIINIEGTIGKNGNMEIWKYGNKEQEQEAKTDGTASWETERKWEEHEYRNG